MHLAEFVEAGGSYLGFCAGAYFAASRVEFEVGTSMEVTGERQLAFFPGVARGSVVQGEWSGTGSATPTNPRP